VGVGGHHVAEQPGEIGHEVVGPRPAERVALRAQRPRGALDDGQPVAHVETLGMPVQTHALALDGRPRLEAGQAQRRARRHGLVGERLGARTRPPR
jgi:hypothetical protein